MFKAFLGMTISATLLLMTWAIITFGDPQASTAMTIGICSIITGGTFAGVFVLKVAEVFATSTPRPAARQRVSR